MNLRIDGAVWTAMLPFLHKRAHLACCTGRFLLLMLSFD